MKIAFRLVAKEREWVISEILKNSKDPLRCCLLWWGFTFYWKGTSKVKRTGECECLPRVEECNTVYHLFVLRVYACVDWWVFAECVFLWCLVSSACNPISLTKQNNNAFTTWIFRSGTCALFSVRVDLFQGLHSAAAQTTGKHLKCFPINLTKTITRDAPFTMYPYAY